MSRHRVQGQLWERIKGPSGTCLKLSVLLWGGYVLLLLWIGWNIKKQVDYSDYINNIDTNYINYIDDPPPVDLMPCIFFGIFVASWIGLLAKIRAVVRRRDRSASCRDVRTPLRTSSLARHRPAAEMRLPPLARQSGIGE